MKTEYKIKVVVLNFLIFINLAVSAQQKITLSKQELSDKIKGGWAGQTIGVTFGGPYEFKFNGTFIQDYQPLRWYDGYLKQTMMNNPGLYDDLYMDLTFVDVYERYGLDAPLDSFAYAYAKADYMLWHANQAGRYNILHGIKAPASGHWKNNPHADCIDYQIEADFAGLMSPGMPNTASQISDKIGHIMNYGDGWYGGVYVGAMYALAFTTNNVHEIVTDALKTIPRQSEFYQCINDVIGWCKKYPSDWKQTWFEVQKKWSEDIGCPDGIFGSFNIDAKVNAAYVVMGLLYGGGDFAKTLEISTRCGQDADCNPSSAGGILGTMLGYKKIPSYWKQGLREAEDIDFKYTTMSLNDVYKIGIKHALENIKRHGGLINDEQVVISKQIPVAVKFEKSFSDVFPIAKIPIRFDAALKETRFEFEGTGFVIRGNFSGSTQDPALEFKTELYVDGKLVESPVLPVDFTTRRAELAWNYGLPKGNHSVLLKSLTESKEVKLNPWEAVIYSDKPVSNMAQKKTLARK